MQYGWRGFSFDLPQGLEDESVLTFIGRDQEKVDLNITVTRDRMEGGFDPYLASAVDDLKKSLSGYKLVDQKPRKIAGTDARVLEHTATNPEGQTLRQLQAYVADGDDVVIITATGHDESRDKLAKAFDGIIESFRAA
jgi:hypothetical protein